GLGGDALHEVTVGGHDPHVMVEGGLAGGGVGVEHAALAPLRHRHADRGGQAGAQGAGRDLDAGRVVHLGVAGGGAAPGPQRLDVVQLHAVAGQVELDVLGQAGVAGGEHEPVPAEPVRVGGVVDHDVLVEQVGQGGQAHGRPRVSVARVLHRVGGQDTDRVHRPDVRVGP